MISMIIVITAFIIGTLFVGNDKPSAYEEYCNLECWSRRKPCCKTP